MPIIHGRVLIRSTIHTDGWTSYDGLIVNGYRHYRVFHSNDEFVRENLTSMALRVSGVLPNDEWRNSMASLNTPLCYT